MVTPTDAKCAACGKGGDGLKECGTCELVRYCGAACQRAHRPQHKMECTKRAAELHDEALFRQPPSREDCPICFLELPILMSSQIYNSCCGQMLCYGCSLASTEQSDECPLCPFCRKPSARSQEENVKRLERRVELNDPNAIFLLGIDYFKGDRGFEQDIGKALELLHRAAELGSIGAHGMVGELYCDGDVVQANCKKAEYHLEIAAMAWHVGARYDLGVMEGKRGNHHRSMKHFIISASAGCDDSLKMVQSGYRSDFVTKYDFEKTLRAHKKSRDELKSEWRNKAAAARCVALG